MIRINNLSVAYETQQALDALDASYKSGQITGLIGPNGAGKSTLLKTCCGLIPHFKGEIFFDGRSLEANRFWVKQKVAYAPESPQLLPYLSGKEFLRLIAGIYKIDDFESRKIFFSRMMLLDDRLDELINTYSHGMMQKLSLAAALISRPEYILIDEALSGLDSIALKNVKDYLSEQAKSGKHVIISSHQIELIQDWCAEIQVINHGKIIGNFLPGPKSDNRNLLNLYQDLIHGT